MKNKILLAAILLTASSAAAQSTNFNVDTVYMVDMQAVLEGSKQGKSAIAALKAQVGASEEKISKAQSELATLRTSIEKQASLLSDKAFKEKQELLIAKSREVERVIGEEQAKNEQLRAREVSQIVGQADKIIAAIGKEKGYPIIVEKGSPIVMYGDKKFDITTQVISKMNG